MIADHTPFTVFHDETKREDETRLKGHVLVFVPHLARWTEDLGLFGTIDNAINPLVTLPDVIHQVRTRYAIEPKRLHFSRLGGRKWTKYDAGHRAVADLAADALRSRPCKALPTPLRLRVAAMFYSCDADLSMYAGDNEEKRLRHDETVLRILLKGALHYLFGSNDPVRLVELVTDGQPAHRVISGSRVLWQLVADEGAGRTPLAEHVQLDDQIVLRSHPSDHKDFAPGSAGYRDCQFLQLADLFLGSISRSCFDLVSDWPHPPPDGAVVSTKKDIIAHPIRAVLKKQSRGVGFRHSSHFRSFSVGRVAFTPTTVSFVRLTPRLPDPRLPPLQLDLDWQEMSEPVAATPDVDVRTSRPQP